MRHIIATLMLALSLVSVAACGAIASALPSVVAAVTDAALILDEIERFVDAYFASRPDAEGKRQAAQAIGKARSALLAANRAATGSQKLDQQQIDAAFSDFRVAYQELTAILDGLRIPGLRVARPGESALQASPGELAVPPPMALTLKVPTE